MLGATREERPESGPGPQHLLRAQQQQLCQVQVMSGSSFFLKNKTIFQSRPMTSFFFLDEK